jgi:hypothetical protein
MMAQVATTISERDFQDVPHKALHQDAEFKVMAMKSIMDPDTLYLWQARKEPDFPKFLETMQKDRQPHQQWVFGDHKARRPVRRCDRTTSHMEYEEKATHCK